jgi:4'-phosphopantetheinyl transferase
MSLLAPSVEALPELALNVDGMAHVWSARVDGPGAAPAMLDLLDARERLRAERFVFGRDRDRYVVRHGFYRRVLAAYMRVRPERVEIAVLPTGRPVVLGSSDLDFNVSHSAGLAMIAVARGRPVGVDVERVRHVADAMSLADDHFSARERGALRSAPAHARSRLFLALWTAKEAVLKASGVGLSLGLNGVEVNALIGGLTDRVISRADGRTFTVARLNGLPDHVGSVALGGDRLDIRHTHITEGLV